MEGGSKHKDIVSTMLNQAKTAVGMAARRVGRSLDGMGAALETHPFTEKCKKSGDREGWEGRETKRETHRDASGCYSGAAFLFFAVSTSL